MKKDMKEFYQELWTNFSSNNHFICVAACISSTTDYISISKKTFQRKLIVKKNLINLTLFIMVNHTSKLNYRIIIVNTVQCDLIFRYLLLIHVLVSWPSSEGIRTTCSVTAVTWFAILRTFIQKLFTIVWIKNCTSVPQNTA
jgi:hypothetical protein